MNKKIILTIIIIGLISFGAYQLFKKEEPTFALFEVVRGDVVQELWETGRVQRGERINLSFKSAGEIERIYIQVNQVVEKGEPLAKLNTRDLSVQLREAEAAVTAYQAQLDKLLAGASQEQIQSVQTSVINTEIALEKAEQNLENVKTAAEENLNNVYQNGLRVLETVYLNAYDAKILIDLVQRTYFTVNDQEGIRVREQQNRTAKATSEIKSQIEAIQSVTEREKIDQGLAKTEISLSVIYNGLGIIRDICESPIYKGKIPDGHKTSLDTHRSTINSALTTLIRARQAISSTKITNTSRINAAEAEVARAEGSLQSAEDQLALILAPPRGEDLNLLRAQLNQAQTRVESLENQMEDAILRSPVKAQVAAVHKREGEQAKAMDLEPVVSLSPLVPFEIVADIYEEDIPKIKIAAPVKITLPAFPKETFKGSVIFIDEAEKIIGGVVYYEIRIGFDEEPPEGIKTTMTADLVIQSGLRENVLVVPRAAIKRVGDKTMVEVLGDGLIQEREVEIGLRGYDMVEIVFGLEEAEKILIR